jgi:hypothetical protein
LVVLGAREHAEVLRDRAEGDVAERAVQITGTHLAIPRHPEDLAAPVKRE